MKVESMKIEYSQDADSCQSNDGAQLLEIETADSGGGVYYIIKTERWAIDDTKDLIKILKDFQKRLKTKNEKG